MGSAAKASTRSTLWDCTSSTSTSRRRNDAPSRKQAGSLNHIDSDAAAGALRVTRGSCDQRLGSGFRFSRQRVHAEGHVLILRGVRSSDGGSLRYLTTWRHV